MSPFPGPLEEPALDLIAAEGVLRRGDEGDPVGESGLGLEECLLLGHDQGRPLWRRRRPVRTAVLPPGPFAPPPVAVNRCGTINSREREANHAPPTSPPWRDGFHVSVLRNPTRGKVPSVS